MGFWDDILNANNSKSSKRFVTLVIAAHFILAAFVILFFACYFILYLPKGRVEPILIQSLEKILQYDFYIILGGLGFVTSEGLVKSIVAGYTSKPDKEEPKQEEPPVEQI